MASFTRRLDFPLQFLLETETLLFAPWYFIHIRCMPLSHRYAFRILILPQCTHAPSCPRQSSSHISVSFIVSDVPGFKVESRDHVRDAGMATDTIGMITLPEQGGNTTVPQGHAPNVVSASANDWNRGKLRNYTFKLVRMHLYDVSVSLLSHKIIPVHSGPQQRTCFVQFSAHKKTSAHMQRLCHQTACNLYHNAGDSTRHPPCRLGNG